jgi:ketosteroid isomerase-like protein
MTNAFTSNLERDGENRPFHHGHAVVGSAGAMSLMRGVFEPGWRWSTDVAPIAGTASCRTRHLGYMLSGRMHIAMDDGTELDIEAGSLFDLPAGHDAWVIGDEPCVMIDTSSDATRYATAPLATADAAKDKYIERVRTGYRAFNERDIPTLTSVLSHDVVQTVPGNSQVAGSYKGIDAVLTYYAKLGELTDGTFRADLVDAHGDGRGHVLALQQISGTRNGVTLVSRGSILFTFLGDRATDLLQLSSDQAGEDAFFA